MRTTYLTTCVALCLCISLCLSAQDEKVYQTSTTIQMTNQDVIVSLSKDQRNQLIKDLEHTLRLNNEMYSDLADPGGGRAFVKSYINPGVDMIVDVLSAGEMTGNLPGEFKGAPGVLGIMTKWRDRYLESEEAEGAVYRAENIFQKSEAANGYFAKLRSLCDNDIDCIASNAEKVIRNDKIRAQVGADFSLFNDATLKQLVIASAKNTELKQDATLDGIVNLEQLVNVGVDKLSTQLNEVSATQNRLVTNTAHIIHLEEQQAVAIAHMQQTIEANQREIDRRLTEGFGEVKELQQQNIFLTSAVLENTRAIQATLQPISENVETIKARQLQQIFDESPTAKKLAMLKGPEGAELYGSNFRGRAEQIENLEEMLKLEKVVTVTNKVREWGQAGKVALDVLCPDCPQEMNQALDIAMTASDIAGGIATGNWAGAITAGLGFFSKPRPSPEMQMLTQIKTQLQKFESGVNARFDALSEQMFRMEENIVARLELVDAKLDMISEQVQTAYTALSEQLSGIDRKLTYVTRQNDCTQNLVSGMFKNQLIDICSTPLALVKQKLAAGELKNYDQLRVIFVGQQCKTCVESLFDIFNQKLAESRLFQYTDCETIGNTEQNRPDKLYEFVYNNLLSPRDKTDLLSVYALLFVPADVRVAASFKDTVARMPENIRQKIRESMTGLTLGDNDKFYRNYHHVLQFTDYALTLLPFLELYNNGDLMKYQQLAADPNLSRQRSETMLGFFDQLAGLIDRTIFQQSLMTGAGTFQAVSNYIKNNNPAKATDGSDIVLNSLFRFDPYFAKNYAAYFVHTKYGGYRGLSRILNSNAIKNRPDKKLDQGYMSVIESDTKGGYRLTVSSQDGTAPFFESSLPALNQKTNEMLYGQYLANVVPDAIVELYAAKNRVNALRSELKFMLSGKLDEPNAELSRKEFNALLQETKQ